MGWIVAFALVALEILWLVMDHLRIITPQVALGLVLVTLGFAVWLVPYFSPVRLK
jgi:hypothetical protein